jgi:hypothetical protein
LAGSQTVGPQFRTSIRQGRITDGTYTISSYVLRYLRKPRPIYLDGTFPTNSAVSELADHKHREILRATVDLAVRATENTVRIQTEPKIIE